MEEEKKEPKESTGDVDNGKDHLNFCLLCTKYAKEKLTPVQIGVIRIDQNKIMPIVVDVCPKCVVIINNAGRIFREAVAAFQKQQAEAKEKRIIVPGTSFPKDFVKGLKGRKS